MFPFEGVQKISFGTGNNYQGLACADCSQRLQENCYELKCGHYVCKHCISMPYCSICRTCPDKTHTVEIHGIQHHNFINKKITVEQELMEAKQWNYINKCDPHRKVSVNITCGIDLCTECIANMVKDTVVLVLDGKKEEHCICMCTPVRGKHIISIKALEMAESQISYVEEVKYGSCYASLGCSEKAVVRFRECAHLLCSNCVRGKLQAVGTVTRKNKTKHEKQVLICGIDYCNAMIPVEKLQSLFEKPELEPSKQDQRRMTAGNSSNLREQEAMKKADTYTEQNHELNIPSPGMDEPSTAGTSVDKQPQLSTSPLINETHEMMKTATFNKRVVSTPTTSDTASEPQTDELIPSKKRFRAYLKEKPGLCSCSRGKHHLEAIIEFSECGHGMCEDCVKKKLSMKYPTLLCGSRKGSTIRCQTNIPIEAVTNFLQDRAANNMNCAPKENAKPACDNPNCRAEKTLKEEIRKTFPCKHHLCISCVCDQNEPDSKIECKALSCMKIRFDSKTQFTCSKFMCRKKAVVHFTDCDHRMCIDCMIKLSSPKRETDKNTVCGIRSLTACQTVIPLQPLNEHIENMKKLSVFYIKEKPQDRLCCQTSCTMEPVIEFRKCSHRMCHNCVREKVSSGETMICGSTYTGLRPCNNEIPTKFVKEYLRNYAENGMNRTPLGHTTDKCDNPNCTANKTQNQQIRHRFTCNHKLCVICVSAQKTREEDKIICKVPDCASSKIGQTDPEITGIPNIGLTCYASCVLQVLAQTPGFKDSLRTYSPDSDKDDVETMLKELLKSVNDVSGREFFVNWNLMQRLMRKIFQIDRSFRQYQENDCHSFIMALFNALMKTEQDHKKQKDVGNSFLDGPDPDDDSGTGKGTENITNDGRPKAEADLGNTTGKSTCPTTLFESRLTSQFEYSSCSHTENVDDQLFYSLLLPAVVEVKSIAEGLDLYFKSEKFPDNMLPCRKCKTQNDRTTTTRTLLMSEAPDMLMIQLARFREVTYRDDHYKELEKTDHQVKFEETLTIKEAYTMDKKELEYELYGVVLHSGNMHGGHYTSCVRNLNSKKWYSCSDSSVCEMPEKSLLQLWTFKNAYLLFYSKKK